MGFGIRRNPKRAIYLFKKTAIAWASPVAEYYVGMMYRDGDGVIQSNEAAIRWLTLSANHGWCDAQINLGYMYHQGTHAKKDFSKALYYYKKALRAKKTTTHDIYLFGNKEFMINYDSKELFLYRLSESVNKMNGCPSPLRTAMSYDQQFHTKRAFYQVSFWYTVCNAQDHHALARSLIGQLYFNGYRNFKKDHFKAKIWFEKAAKDGSAQGQILMGSFCEYQKDYQQALMWYTTASKHGSRDALFKIAEYYFHIKKDFNKAKEYCQLILDQIDHGQAYHMLGNIYFTSAGNKKINYARATQCYLKATAHSCPESASRLELLVESGFHEPKKPRTLGLFRRKQNYYT